MRSEETRFHPSMLRLGRDLRAVGEEPVRDPTLVRVRRGVWMDRATWSQLDRAARHTALVHATAQQCPDPQALVFSHSAAAACWGLPRIGDWPERVDVLVAPRRVRSSTRIVKHIGRAAETRLLDGLQVTTPARTIVDLARTSSLASGVVAADHGLRVRLCTRVDLAAELAGLPNCAPGVRRAAAVVALADPSAESVGESLSRAQMYLARIPRPALQVPYDDEAGHIGRVDFEWDGVIGEFDGRVKYAVSEGTTAADAGRILWEEKRREDRLRRRAEGFVRWDWSVAMHRNRLVSRLASVGIHPRAGGDWLAQPRRRAS